MYILKIITFILVVLGALNWGLVGAFNFDLVAALFGAETLIARIVYSLIGLSAVLFMFLAASDIFEKNE